MLDFFLQSLNYPMDLQLEKGRLLAIFGYIINFYFLWPYVAKCITMGYYFHVWGGVGVGLFFCDKYLY